MTPALHLLSRLELNQSTAMFLFLTEGEGDVMLKRLLKSLWQEDASR